MPTSPEPMLILLFSGLCALVRRSNLPWWIAMPREEHGPNHGTHGMEPPHKPILALDSEGLASTDIAPDNVLIDATSRQWAIWQLTDKTLLIGDEHDAEPLVDWGTGPAQVLDFPSVYMSANEKNLVRAASGCVDLDADLPKILTARVRVGGGTFGRPTSYGNRELEFTDQPCLRAPYADKFEYSRRIPVRVSLQGRDITLKKDKDIHGTISNFAAIFGENTKHFRHYYRLMNSPPHQRFIRPVPKRYNSRPIDCVPAVQLPLAE